MVAQQGTLNIVGSGGFVVMAIPVDAFTGVDDNGDGLMSAAELRAHAGALEAQVQLGLQLMGRAGACPLEGLMITLSPDDLTPSAPAAHIVVLGRFALREGDTASAMTLRFTLFGKAAQARQQHVTVTQGEQIQHFVVRPGREAHSLFPSAGAIILDHAALGAEHVLRGVDHLLFLLVVLITGSRFRQCVLALSCFTLGHAIMLACGVLWGMSVPAHFVEPVIAASIVGVVVFDGWSQRRPQPFRPAVRLSLIFVFALVHGLGFAGALADLGLDAHHRLLSMLGFNAGIEAAQLVVALLASAVMWSIQRFKGEDGRALTMRFASYFAVVTGSLWMLERIIVAM